jgi:hypothetical protein
MESLAFQEGNDMRGKYKLIWNYTILSLKKISLEGPIQILEDLSHRQCRKQYVQLGQFLK